MRRWGHGVAVSALRPRDRRLHTPALINESRLYRRVAVACPANLAATNLAARALSPPSSTHRRTLRCASAREEWARRVATRRGAPSQLLAVRSWPCSTLNLATYAALGRAFQPLAEEEEALLDMMRTTSRSWWRSKELSMLWGLKAFRTCHDTE